MDALFQDRLADWPSVETKLLTLTLTVQSSSRKESHGKFVEDLWKLNVWIEDCVSYNYSNLESVTIICSYD
jgi:hypothetical protein